MLAWAKCHVPEALLIPAGIGAVAVTALSDIPEVVPWGHELGVGVSSLALAYVGGYIFNWLIVERPRARALRGFYLAANASLSSIANMPSNTMGALYMLAEHPHVSIPLPPDDFTQDDVRRWVLQIEWNPFSTVYKNSLLELAEVRRLAHESLMPLLGFFEPEVSAAIARTSAAARVHLELAEMLNHPDSIVMSAWRERLALHLYWYHQAGASLKMALSQSEYTPSMLRWGEP